MEKEKFWKKYFQVYDTLNSLIPYRELLESVIKELSPKKGELVFEGGCGTGNLLLKIKEKGADVIGTDFSKAALEILKKKDNSVKVILSDLAKKLPFENDYFDKAVLNNTLYLFPKKTQVKILKEIKRVLKKGGLIVLANPKNGWSPMKIYVDGIRKNLKEEGLLKTIIKVAKMILPTAKIIYYNFFIKKETGYFFPTEKEQKNILKEAGFRVISEPKFVYSKQGVMNSAKK